MRLAKKKKAPQTNPDSQFKSEPALELHSGAASSVGVISPFQRSRQRKHLRSGGRQKFLFLDLISMKTKFTRFFGVHFCLITDK